MDNDKCKYLYGAAVQGIQSFIFQTNELKDIVGASHIVNEICSSFSNNEGVNGENILSAAGNIKHIFTSKADCEYAVRNFPKRIIEMAPGITISQAVVEIIDNEFEKAVNKLEELLRAQRNKPFKSTTIGLTGIKRSPTTGLPASHYHEKKLLDDASYKKKMKTESANDTLNERFFGKKPEKDSLPMNISRMTDNNDWIAVIHADGNGLGQIVAKIGKDSDQLKKFSHALDEATIEAAKSAYLATEMFCSKGEWGTMQTPYPFRPIVIGGDDLTIICRADLAIEFTQRFLAEFEIQTKDKLSVFTSNAGIGNNLTACAGIAFIKSSYPFYYGYNLAETLCGEAKKDAKEEKRMRNKIARSCLMFHKVQDSFVDNFSQIVERELTTKAGVGLNFGPYYLDTEGLTDRWTIDNLINNSEILDTESKVGVRSHIRRWLTMLDNNYGLADQRIHRLKSLVSMEGCNDATVRLIEQITMPSGSKGKTPAYDMLSYLSVKYQKTK